SHGETTRIVLVHTVDGSCRLVTSEPSYQFLLEPQLRQFARPRVLRHKFHGIVVGKQQLGLMGRRDMVWPLRIDRHAVSFLLPREHDHPLNHPPIVPFQTIQVRSKESPSLQLAQWSDGSRAWLDSRGLLHLRSSDPNVPQCTIVLAEKELAG